jgi:hypothetical protein
MQKAFAFCDFFGVSRDFCDTMALRVVAIRPADQLLFGDFWQHGDV